MKNFSTWLLVMFMAMFWFFRVLVAVMPEFGTTLGNFVPLNSQLEIALCFLVLVCMVLVVKRKLVGGLIYLAGYGMYFGVDLFNNLGSIMNGTLGAENALNTFVSFLGIVLPIAVLLDLLIDKGRKINPTDKKTDWFYKNDQFDRKYDQIAYEHNYRTL